MISIKEEGFQFTDFQDQILSSIVQQFQKQRKINFKQISISYNQQMRKENQAIQRRTPQVLRERYYLLHQSVCESAWTKELEKMMLKLVSQGKSWSQIQKIYQFQSKGFSNNFIKNQFQTCQRMKIRALASYFVCGKIKNISDSTFRTIIQPKKIFSLIQDAVISNLQAKIILSEGCQAYFLSSRLDSQNKILRLRKKEIKQKVFHKYHLQREGKEIIQIIMKINESMRKTKRLERRELQDISSEISQDLKEFCHHCLKVTESTFAVNEVLEMGEIAELSKSLNLFQKQVSET